MKDLSESRILIVDDVKANVDLLVQALRDDYKISVALNGEAALQSVEKNLPDLLLLDIVMPGIDGYEVCRRLRSVGKTRELPIMFLSSLEDVGDKTKGFESGGNDYLTKPFEILEVKARVKSLLKAKAYSDEVKERISAELRIAREIQQGLFPRRELKIPGIEVIGRCNPATETGGDYFDWCELSSDEGFVTLGDAAGHGLGPSLLIASCRAYVRADLPKDKDLAGFMNRLNTRLAEDMEGSRFVTFVGAIINAQTANVKLLSAGHCPVLFMNNRSKKVSQIKAHGVPLGVMSEAKYCDGEVVHLEAGDRIVIYTDGITEAKRADGVMFGTDRLSQAVICHNELEGQSFVDALFREAMDFTGNAALQDDLTILSLRRL
jgi:serine phosphatase RsbU (regulator of sigma subunit)